MKRERKTAGLTLFLGPSLTAPRRAVPAPHALPRTRAQMLGLGDRAKHPEPRRPAEKCAPRTHATRTTAPEDLHPRRNAPMLILGRCPSPGTHLPKSQRGAPSPAIKTHEAISEWGARLADSGRLTDAAGSPMGEAPAPTKSGPRLEPLGQVRE